MPLRHVAATLASLRYAAPMPTSDNTRRSTATQFATWLRSAMETAGFPTVGSRSGGQARLAEASGVTTSIVSRALNGSSTPDIDAILTLAETLGTDPVDGLRAAGHDRLVELIEKRSLPPAAPAPDPASARIERSPSLNDVERAWLARFYRRRIEAAREDATREIVELVDMLERQRES